MEAIRQQLLNKGGTLADWGRIITNGLQAEDQQWVDAKAHPGDVLAHARAVMSKDGIMEYECMDDRGRAQGTALVRLLDWEDHAQGILRAELWPVMATMSTMHPKSSKVEKGFIMSAVLNVENAVSGWDVEIAVS